MGQTQAFEECLVVVEGWPLNRDLLVHDELDMIFSSHFDFVRLYIFLFFAAFHSFSYVQFLLFSWHSFSFFHEVGAVFSFHLGPLRGFTANLAESSLSPPLGE